MRGPRGLSKAATLRALKGVAGAGNAPVRGPAGDDGVGVPTGGTTGQVLAKVDATDYNTTWTTPSGGGGSSATTIEVDLGAATWRGRFTITDAGIAPTSKVLCWQAAGPYTGKGTRADEAEMQAVSVVSVASGTGSAVVTWETPPAYTAQLILPSGNRFVGTALNEQMLLPTLIPRRVGKVRGNVKFSYLILS